MRQSRRLSPRKNGDLSGDLSVEDIDLDDEKEEEETKTDVKKNTEVTDAASSHLGDKTDSGPDSATVANGTEEADATEAEVKEAFGRGAEAANSMHASVRRGHLDCTWE